jgi:hypothetical protein
MQDPEQFICLPEECMGACEIFVLAELARMRPHLTEILFQKNESYAPFFESKNPPVDPYPSRPLIRGGARFRAFHMIHLLNAGGWPLGAGRGMNGAAKFASALARSTNIKTLHLPFE